MQLGKDIEFLRADTTKLPLNVSISFGFWGIGDLRFFLAYFLRSIPVCNSRNFKISVLRHLIKLTFCLPLLFARRNQVLLSCESNLLSCTNRKILQWLLGPDRNRVVIGLLLVASMAGDLSWRRKKEELDEYEVQSDNEEGEQHSQQLKYEYQWQGIQVAQYKVAQMWTDVSM